MNKQTYHHGDLRATLLVAAEQELVERGVEKFSLRGVAKRTGVSHAAPAHHFGGVSGLLTALAVVGFNRFSQSLQQRIDMPTIQNSSQAILVGLGYIDFAITNSHLFSLMFSSSYPDFDDPELDAVSMKSFEYLLNSTGVKSGAHDVNGSGIDVKAMAAWSTIHGVSELLLSGRMRSVLSLPKEKQEDAIQRILEQAIEHSM